jgi:hypothetical protein
MSPKPLYIMNRNSKIAQLPEQFQACGQIETGHLAFSLFFVRSAGSELTWNHYGT